MCAFPERNCGGDTVNLNFLKTFVHVVEAGNFSRAAERVHLSQPAVSMQMQALAQDLGVELFRRRGHKLETTEAGAILYAQARRFLQDWQAVLHKLESVRQRLQGRLALGASTTPGDYLLPQLLCQFHSLHPELEVRMEVGSSEEIVSALLDGRLDLAVVGYQPQDDALEAQVVFEDQLVAVFAPDYGLARLNKVGVEDLLAQPLLQRTQGSATRQVLERALGERGYDPDDMKIIMELGSSRALLEAAARGLGVAVVSKAAAADYTDSGRLAWACVEGLELRRNFWLVQSRRLRSAAQQAFVQFLLRSDLRG